MRFAATTFTLAMAALLVAGCASAPSGAPGGGTSGRGGGYYQNDGPPDDEEIDIASIPDAVPRDEPLSRYGNPSSYEALGKTYYVLKSAAGFTQTGRASWYGRQFHGRRTSSGEPYNMFKMTAAHKRLPIPSYVRVTNLDNGEQVIVRVNDRGPFHDGRIIDLSYVAARRLDIVSHGSAPVRIETVTPDSLQAERGRQPDTPTPLRRPSTPTTSRGASVVASGSNAPRTGSVPSRETPTAARSIPVSNGPPASRSDAGGLYLQAGAFGQPTNARQLREELRAAGFQQVSIVQPDGATPLYRVRLGPFDNDRGRHLTQQILVERGFAAREVER